jgi:hypothetical protein
MQLRHGSRMTAGAVSAWFALALAVAAGAAGLPLPRRAPALLAAVALAVSIALSVRTLLGAWRGPVITSFPRRDAVLCDPPGADAVRAGAQLRGTMGGAGHVHPARLVFPAAGWAAAAGVAAAVLRAPSPWAAPPWPVALAVAAAAGAALALPAQPFFYREVTGGRVLVFPPEACARLLEHAAPARHQEEGGDAEAVAGPAEGPGGWVSSRNPMETRGNCPTVDPAQPR